MSLAKKLQLKPGQTIRVLRAPEATDLGDVQAGPDAPAVLLFVRSAEELREHGAAAVEAGRRDALAWIAYPKAGKLGTDLNRDLLWRQLEPEGVRPVRMISLDAVWSAMRIRPA